MKYLYAILIFLLISTPQAGATILFIDTNNAPQEVAAAREAAKKNKEEFLLFPEEPNTATRIALTKLRTEALNARKKADKCGGKQTKNECDTLSQEAEAAQDKLSFSLEKYKITQEKLSEFIAKHAEKGGTFETIVISGHDGTGLIHGDFGEIGDTQLANELNKYPQITNSLRALYLWGCNTITPASLSVNWKKYFPNVSLLVGFDDSAPLSDKKEGWQFLNAALRRQNSLLTAQDAKSLQNILLSMPGALEMHAAVSVCDNVATIKKTYALSQSENRCKEMRKIIMATEKKYDCYLKANTPECANPPEDTQNGFIRNYYRTLQNVDACNEIFPELNDYSNARDQAIRLTLFRNLIENFSRIYKKALQEEDEILASLGAPPELNFSNMKNLTRAEIMNQIVNLDKFILSPALADSADDNKAAKVSQLIDFSLMLKNILVQLDHFCTPFGWVSPNSNDLSKCYSEANLGHAGVARKLTNIQKKINFIDQ